MASASSVNRSAAPESGVSQILAGVEKGYGYAGNISPEDAYRVLTSEFSVLIDVRTLPEWQFIGTPDISATKGKLATICWKNYPDFSLNTKFASQIDALGVSKDAVLLFLCRSGGRSTDAAIAMTQAGYTQCYNIEDGFEGEPDSEGHRGVSRGWKAKKLPWKQG